MSRASDTHRAQTSFPSESIVPPAYSLLKSVGKNAKTGESGATRRENDQHTQCSSKKYTSKDDGPSFQNCAIVCVCKGEKVEMFF